jgi:hypothetical protein
MIDNRAVTLQIEPFSSSEQRLFTAKSYLIDRIEADVEQILLPPASTRSGRIEYSFPNSDTTRASNSANKKEKLNAEFRNRFKPITIDSPLLIDLRVRWPDNWAHALNNHLPLALYLRDQVNPSQRGDVSVLFDCSIPSYVTNLFELFGFRAKKSSGRVTAAFIDFKVEPWICLRSIAYKWLREYFHDTGLKNRIFSEIEEMPKKVYLARRKTRFVRNQEQLTGFLSSLGFVTVYPEDLSIQKQLKLFADARQVVAVHGASIGPLLYRDQNSPQLKFVEILSPAHMTNYYRIMSDQVGALWSGVRGRIEPKHLKYAYKENQAFTKYSLSSFHVDIESLKAAMKDISCD